MSLFIAPIVLTGTNLVYTKKYNLRIVHEVIRLFGPLSRAEVARHTELSVQTVSNLVKELLALHLVQEGGRRSEGRGAPSTDLTLARRTFSGAVDSKAGSCAT